MSRLLVATSNPGKMLEIRALLTVLPIDLITPADLGLDLRVEETGQTYAENASLKATAYAAASGLPCLADDSGLEVDALGGEPGLYSARYLGEGKGTDAERRAILLHRLRDKPRPWSARFRAAVAIATPDGRLRSAVGHCEGEIIPQERGDNGFGYDPIFLVGSEGHTMAELDMAAKNRVSHRANAIRNAMPLLQSLLHDGTVAAG